MMASRFPYKDPQPLQPASMIQPNVPGFLGRTIWPQQQMQQQQQVDEQKQREYWKQQQKLKLMSGNLRKQPVSADKLIENLLEKKDTFKPKVNPQPVPSAQVSSQPIQNVQGHPVGSITNLGFSQAHPGYPSIPMAHHSVPTPLADIDLTQGYSKRSPQIGAKTVNPEISTNKTQPQLPAWLSSLSPNLPALYRQIWMCAGSDKGFVDTMKIFPILLTSGLPTDVLGYIWGLANQKVAGQLTEEELYIVLALVALAQAGCAFNSVSILSVVPQPPIPNLNVNVVNVAAVQQPEVVDVKVHHEVLDTQMKTDSNADPIDEFTDFQSAVLETSPSVATASSAITVKENVPPLDNSFLMSDSNSASSVPDVTVSQKFPSVVVMGNTGRGIGSRLANHSLGMPRQVKARHHKHHHHHHRSHHTAVIAVDDEFSEFQQAKDPENGDSSDTSEIFAKCIPKPIPSKTFVLKESAIRTEEKNDNVHHLRFSKSDLNMPEKTVEIKVADVVKPALEERLSSSSSKELMSVEEDKYSALRALSFTGDDSSAKKTIENVHENATDDFGDFLSAELSPATNSFAEVAAVQGSIWPSSSAEFKVEDWGAFESAESPHISSSGWATNIGTKPISSESKPDHVLSKNSLDFVDGNFSWDLNLAPIQETKSVENLTFRGVSITGNVNENDSWNLELGEETVEKVSGVSLLGKIYDSSGQDSDKVNMFTSASEPSVEGNSFVIEDKADEFGEFIGPETWSTDSKFNKDILFDIQTSSVIKESTFDNQSVSSLELPPLALSRHGSLPSLDLKIFPQNGEKNNGHQVWDTSSQGQEHQIPEWCRCVQGCLELLQAAHSTFSNISSDDVLHDVLQARKGRDYLYNLLEVYGVCQRVRHSANHVLADSKQLESILIGVDSAWADLEQFYAIAEITTDLEFVLENQDNSDSRENFVCGICLNSIGSDLMESDINSYHLEYGGQVYHAACANLWVNCVDCSLPSLTLL